MKDYTATWFQPYLVKVFNGEPVIFNDFLKDSRSSFFDHNHWHCAKVALWNLRQTGTMLAYTQDLDQNTHTPIMSFYQHRCKEKIQLAVVMRNIEFDSLRSMQVMVLKAVPVPAPLPPNLMQWTSLHSRRPQSTNSPIPSQARWVQLNLYFRCGQASHISRRCYTGQKTQDHLKPPSSAWMSKLQEETNCLCTNPSTSSPALL
ncbi:uncharacterized protein VP01_912g1 [Puccinia sorghi]|uniref:Retrotransposon gag domain-containing protein n=1 Tax=Puccinia sorghi TaxID=27349 RepID=A0A0L6U9M9_9BASI|nr:uncharacterized protein VP01_912g1 [Puccinia sorghi]